MKLLVSLLLALGLLMAPAGAHPRYHSGYARVWAPPYRHGHWPRSVRVVNNYYVYRDRFYGPRGYYGRFYGGWYYCPYGGAPLLYVEAPGFLVSVGVPVSDPYCY